MEVELCLQNLDSEGQLLSPLRQVLLYVLKSCIKWTKSCYGFLSSTCLWLDTSSTFKYINSNSISGRLLNVENLHSGILQGCFWGLLGKLRAHRSSQVISQLPDDLFESFQI